MFSFFILLVLYYNSFSISLELLIVSIIYIVCHKNGWIGVVYVIKIQMKYLSIDFCLIG